MALSFLTIWSGLPAPGTTRRDHKGNPGLAGFEVSPTGRIEVTPEASAPRTDGSQSVSIPYQVDNDLNHRHAFAKRGKCCLKCGTGANGG